MPGERERALNGALEGLQRDCERGGKMGNNRLHRSYKVYYGRCVGATQSGPLVGVRGRPLASDTQTEGGLGTVG